MGINLSPIQGSELMCGIAGWLSVSPVDDGESAVALQRLRQEVRMRGPDGEGEHLALDGRLGLAHTRLAVIDPRPRSDQPFVDPITGAVVAFNGEIYNFRALKADLVQAGASFRTEGDAEVLLQGYLRHGLVFFRRLRGMYAFVLFDPSTRTVIALRDPMGIKPLYLHTAPERVVFGSSPAAASALMSDRRLDPAAAVSVAVLGCVLEPLSPYLGVEQIEPGVAHCFQIVDDAVRVRREKLDPEFVWSDGSRDGGLDRLGAVLRESVAAHFTADVPVAIFQSAGLDSTLISTLAAIEGLRPTLLTLGFEVFRGTPMDEVPGAMAVAEHLKLDHQHTYVTRSEFEALQQDYFRDMQSPTGDGLNTYLIARFCRESGHKVALSGVGGDELFAGYPSFQQLPRLNAFGALATTFVGRSLLHAGFHAAWLINQRRSAKLRYFSDYLADWGRRYLLRRAYFAPEELGTVLKPEVAVAGLARFWLAYNGLNKASSTADVSGVRALECDVYLRNVLLRDTDWAGMAHGVEIRTPFVDAKLYRALCDPRDRCDYTKEDLRLLARRLDPSFDLAPRRKTGFLVPHNAWSVSLESAQIDPLAYGSLGARAWNRRVLKQWFGDWAL